MILAFYQTKVFRMLLLLLPLGIQAQDLTALTQKHAGYSEVISEYRQTYTLTQNKEKLNIKRDTYEEYFLLESDAKRYALSDYIIFSHLNPLLSFDAYTLSLQQSKYKKIPPKGISEAPLDRNNIFHSDIKKKIINFSGLTPGSKRILSFTHEFTDPFLIQPFRVMSHVPNEHVVFEIITDKDIDLAFTTFNTEKTDITFTQEVKKGKNVYRWKLTSIPILKFEDNTPSLAYSLPTIYFWVTSMQVNKEKKQLLGTVDHLYRYYSGFIKTLNTDLSPEFTAFTLDLTKNITSEEEKVKAIYQWVQQNIKYIAFEAGYDGFIPRKADLVYTRRYGDCKDMASIITAMAQTAGIHNVYMAWVGTRDIPYTYHQLPTPNVDNHMIAFYDNGAAGICLDATNSFLPFGMIPSAIQTKELLLALNNKDYKIHPLSITPPEDNSIKMTDHLTIHGLDLVGKGELQAFGYFKSKIHAMYTYGGQKNKDEIIESIVNKDISKLKVNKINALDNLDLSNKGVSISFDYTIPNAIIAAGNELYIDLFLYKPFQKLTLTLPREHPFEFSQAEQYDSKIILTLPKGYKIKHLPTKQHFSNAYLDASFEFKKISEGIALHYVVQSKKLLLNPVDFEAWNATIKELTTNYSETIIIEKP